MGRPALDLDVQVHIGRGPVVDQPRDIVIQHQGFLAGKPAVVGVFGPLEAQLLAYGKQELHRPVGLAGFQEAFQGLHHRGDAALIIRTQHRVAAGTDDPVRYHGL